MRAQSVKYECHSSDKIVVVCHSIGHIVCSISDDERDRKKKIRIDELCCLWHRSNANIWEIVRSLSFHPQLAFNVLSSSSSFTQNNLLFWHFSCCCHSFFFFVPLLQLSRVLDVAIGVARCFFFCCSSHFDQSVCFCHFTFYLCCNRNTIPTLSFSVVVDFVFFLSRWPAVFIWQATKNEEKNYQRHTRHVCLVAVAVVVCHCICQYYFSVSICVMLKADLVQI